MDIDHKKSTIQAAEEVDCHNNKVRERNGSAGNRTSHSAAQKFSKIL
jgi:hypothetical protein